MNSMFWSVVIIRLYVILFYVVSVLRKFLVFVCSLVYLVYLLGFYFLVFLGRFVGLFYFLLCGLINFLRSFTYSLMWLIAFPYDFFRRLKQHMKDLLWSSTENAVNEMLLMGPTAGDQALYSWDEWWEDRPVNFLPKRHNIWPFLFTSLPQAFVSRRRELNFVRVGMAYDYLLTLRLFTSFQFFGWLWTLVAIRIKRIRLYLRWLVMCYL